MRNARWLLGEHEGFRPTIKGRSELRALGVDLGGAFSDRRPIVRLCLDRTERRPHIGGRLGIRLADRLFELEWIERVPGSRAVTITPPGAKQLPEAFPSFAKAGVT
jgi:hypothetical protein